MVLPSKNSHTEIVYEHPGDQQNFKYGFEDGSLDAEEGVLSLCATKKCIAQNPYERGYKLGYKKGIQEKGLAGNLVIEPLIDSPGKTVGSDFNGDGIHDFIVGAYVTSSTWVGAAYIFFGASTLSGTKNLKTTASADVTILGKAINYFFGQGTGGGRSSRGP